MSFTRMHYGDVDPVADGLHFLRDPLDCEQLGVSLLDVGPAWTGKPHDHADEGHEEVYVCVDGSATVDVDGESVPMEDGDALRIAPGATRQIESGPEGCRFVLVGAP